MSKYFAFLDLETTGLYEDEDIILEIAWVLTDSNLDEVAPRRSFVLNQYANLDKVDARMGEYVRSMHKGSGLLADIYLGDQTVVPTVVGRAMYDDIHSVWTEEDSIHLAGYSVGFDREFLKRSGYVKHFFKTTDAPKLSFHHRLMDLSSIKLMYELAGRKAPTPSNPNPHRALTDVLETLEFARLVRDDLTPSH